MYFFKNALRVVVFCLFSVAIVYSCQKEGYKPGQQTNDNNSSLFLFPPGILDATNSELFMVASGPIGRLDRANIRVYGSIKNHDNESVGFEQILINDVDVADNPAESGNSEIGVGKFSSYFRNDSDNLDSDWYKLYSSFGNDAEVKILVSEETGSINVNQEMPKILDVSLSQNGVEITRTENKISTSQPFTITWSLSDGGLNFRSTANYVAASVVYHAGLNDDPNLPQDNISVYDVKESSVGSITFTAEQLSSLPLGGSVTVYIGTANQGVYQTDGIMPSSISISGITYEFSSSMDLIE